MIAYNFIVANSGNSEDNSTFFVCSFFKSLYCRCRWLPFHRTKKNARDCSFFSDFFSLLTILWLSTDLFSSCLVFSFICSPWCFMLFYADLCAFSSLSIYISGFFLRRPFSCSSLFHSRRFCFYYLTFHKAQKVRNWIYYAINMYICSHVANTIKY